LRLTLLNLLEQAERIRSSLAALAAHAAMASEALAKEADDGARDDQIRRLMAGAADALNRIAGALSLARAERAAQIREVNEKINRLAVPADGSWR